MGKKGKRSKQKAARKEAEKIFDRNEKLFQEACNDESEDLISKAAIQYREVIRLHESESKLMMLYSCFRNQQIEIYYRLMRLEYRRRNYNEAIECYNYTMANFTSDDFKNMRLMFSLKYQLIMVRLNRQECHLSDFVNMISKEITEKKKASSIVFYDAVDTFRIHKQFDSAIRLEKTFGSLLRSPMSSKIFLALSYFEQYRVEFSRMRKEDFLNIRHLMDSLVSEYPIPEYPFESNDSPMYCMLLAQYYYLTHTLVHNERTKEESVTKSLTFLKLFLTGLQKVKQVCCFTCGQVATPTEVKFVCSGCRIASYCSIDHQRATWKKEALGGSRIGHEILCPLYNAYRKYSHSKDLKDEVKESRMKRRLDRECVKFLADGLGLKNKCFPCEYQA